MRKTIGYIAFILVCAFSILTAAGYIELTGAQSIMFVIAMAGGIVLAINLICSKN